MAVAGLATLKKEAGDGEKVLTLRAVLLHLKAAPPGHMAPLTFIQGRVGSFLSHLLRASLLFTVEHKLQKLGPLLPSALWPLFPEVHLDLVSTYIFV